VLVVNPDRTDLLADEGEEILTLVTCYPFYWIGPAPQRLVVRASPQFKAPFDREALGAGTPETSADPPGS
jgi:sortase (surface protein transpeptidase)